MSNRYFKNGGKQNITGYKCVILTPLQFLLVACFTFRVASQQLQALLLLPLCCNYRLSVTARPEQQAAGFPFELQAGLLMKSQLKLNTALFVHMHCRGLEKRRGTKRVGCSWIDG